MFTLPYGRTESDDEVVKAYKRVFSTPDGRVVLNHLLGEVCDMRWANEGSYHKQSVGYRLLNIIRGDE